MCEKPFMRGERLNSLAVLVPFLRLPYRDRPSFLSLYYHPGSIDAEKEKLIQAISDEKERLKQAIIDGEEKLKQAIIVEKEKRMQADNAKKDKPMQATNPEEEELMQAISPEEEERMERMEAIIEEKEKQAMNAKIVKERIMQGINADKGTLVQVDAEEFPTEEQFKIMAIANTNAFAAADGWVICLEAARINHSCVPNVHHCWNPSLGAVTVHAIRDILKGEEIFITYTGVREDLALRRETFSKYGFECTCPCCDPFTAFGQASRMRRGRLLQIDREWDQVRDATQALAVTMESLDLLREEGICNMELTRA